MWTVLQISEASHLWPGQIVPICIFGPFQTWDDANSFRSAKVEKATSVQHFTIKPLLEPTDV